MQYICLILVSLMFHQSFAQQRTNSLDQATELGKVSWYRNYDQALQLAEQQDKAVLLLFQEVPGCSTCKNYGQQVLSHPLLVEAIEDLFIPLVIYNNKGGADKKVLQRYREPSWNNPVVRIIDQQGADLVDRVSGNYTSLGLYHAMLVALKAEGKSVPKYVQLLGEELKAMNSAHTQMAYFKMYCFWSGEGHLGAANGVVATVPGFMKGHEVVQVQYDERVISEVQLIEYAKRANCSWMKNNGAFRTDKDPQYYLKHTNYKYLPLSPIQRSRINSALGQKGQARDFLSPRQKRWLDQLSGSKKKLEVLYEQDFRAAWEKMMQLKKA